MNIENTYRITTNGLRYRIEHFELTGLWWKRKLNWIPISYCFQREYYSLADAEKIMALIIKEEKAKEHGWTSTDRII